MSKKNASSQAAWALLTEGVALARVETHRMRHLVERALGLIEKSPEKEHLYQVAGDIILGMPQRLDKMEVVLDRTGLALSKMGEEFLEARLPLSEKRLVDDAIESAFGGSQLHQSVERVASRYIEAVNIPRAHPKIKGVLDSLTMTPSYWHSGGVSGLRWEFPDMSYVSYFGHTPNRVHVTLFGNREPIAQAMVFVKNRGVGLDETVMIPNSDFVFEVK